MTAKKPKKSQKNSKKPAKKSNPFRNASLFNFSYDSSDFRVAALAAAIEIELLNSGLKICRKHDAWRRHIRCVLLNLFAASYVHNRRYVWLEMDRNAYSEEIRYKPNYRSHWMMSGIIEHLNARRLITRQRGYFDSVKGTGHATRIRAKTRLLDEFCKHDWTLDLVRAQDMELIRLKDQNKKLIDYQDNDQTTTERNNLREINDGISEAFIGLDVTDEELIKLNERLIKKQTDPVDPDPNEPITSSRKKYPIDFSRTQMYRVYNDGCFQAGGRFVGGWWQNVPSELRQHIRIARPGRDQPVPVAEVDYSSMFPRIAYALVGLRPPKDAYETGGFVPEDQRDEARRVLKAAMQRLLNAKSHPAAFASMQKYYKETKVPKDLPGPEEAIAFLEERHHPLRELFFYNPGQGKYLMYVESMIAERVMLGMLDEGVIVLPIHDSFLVDWRYEEALIRTMEQVFQAELGQRGAVKRDNTPFIRLVRGVKNEFIPELKARGYNPRTVNVPDRNRINHPGPRDGYEEQLKVWRQRAGTQDAGCPEPAGQNTGADQASRYSASGGGP